MANKQPRIYYAHPMSWYDTKEEAADVKALSAHGVVSNPNSEWFKYAVDKAKAHGEPVMQLFADYIQHKSDVVAYRRFNDGRLGAGVAREILEARIWGKEVWEVIGPFSDGKCIVNKLAVIPGQFDLAEVLAFEDILTVDETRARVVRRQL